MQYKDYYRILGVGRNASEAEIRQAYKKLAVKYHPDVNPGNPKAEKRFKEISEAKKILCDAKLRARYDAISRVHAGAGATTGAASGPGGSRINNVFSTFFEEVFGTRMDTRRGRNYEANLHISLHDAYRGVSDIYTFEDRRIKLHLKPGIKHEQTLLIKGQGGHGRLGGEPGDLYLTILIKPHSVFTRQGNDLVVDLPVSVYDLVLGNKVTVPSIKGNMSVQVPPGSQSGERLKLKGLGMPHYDDPTQFGDLYAVIQIQTPTKLTRETRRLWEQLRSLDE